MSKTPVVSAAAFTIHNLKQQVADRDAEIKELNRRIEAMAYIFMIHQDSIRKVLARDAGAMTEAQHGNFEKPVLREIKDEVRTEG